jgi:hypothetical protein
MSVAHTVAPSSANICAVSRPIPWPAAVMNAVLPPRRLLFPCITYDPFLSPAYSLKRRLSSRSLHPGLEFSGLTIQQGIDQLTKVIVRWVRKPGPSAGSQGCSFPSLSGYLRVAQHMLTYQTVSLVGDCGDFIADYVFFC